MRRAAPARRPAGGDRRRPDGRLARLGLQALLDAPDPTPPVPPRSTACCSTRPSSTGLAAIPRSWRQAAGYLAAHKGPEQDEAARRLVQLVTTQPNPKSPQSIEIRRYFLDRLLKARPEGLVEGVQILIDRPEAVVRVLTRYGYTDPETIGGFLDRDLPAG